MIIWLVKEAKKDGIEQILFLVRKGYVLITQYRNLCELIKEIDMPEAVYLEVSRRAIWGATPNNKKDIYKTAEFPYGGKVLDFLRGRFGVKIEDKNPEIMHVAEGYI